MKKQVLWLFLLISGLATAQVVNIPDANFKSILLSSGPNSDIAMNNAGVRVAIDANADGEIQTAEAAAVWEMNLQYYSIPASTQQLSLTGLSAFVNLRKFTTGNNPFITELDLSGLPHIQKVNCSNSWNLESLNVSGLSTITELESMLTKISTLDLTGVVNLRKLNVFDSNITSINLSGLSLLETLDCSGNLLNELSVGTNVNLKILRCYSNNITSLDVSGCPLLNTLSCSNPLTYLNIKNGNSAPMTEFSAMTSPGGTLTICVDDGEEEYVQNYYAMSSQQPVITTYCTFTPGGAFNTFAGSLSYNNGSGCTAVIGGIRFAISDGAQNGTTISNNVGQFHFYPQAGNFTITPQLENSGWFTVTPPSATVAFADNNNHTATQNFCISPVGSHPDVDIVIVPRFAQPGFDSIFDVIYKNKGNQMLSGNVSVTYDDTVMDFVSSSVAPTSNAAGNLLFNYANLQPFESRTVSIVLNMNGPMDTPALNNGDQLDFTASITPTAGDETPADNTFVLEQTLVGSFDPNDITCLEGDTEHPDRIGEYLHYNVNFENTGTAPATFIVVKDIIDVAKFDVSSLQLIEASHNVATRINGNKVEFYFDAINLGPNEKGNVVFKIKTLPTLAVNSSVTQNANIYFDYNWPIVTNNATTTFQLLSAGDFNRDTTVKLFPNPAATQVSITAQSLITSIQLFDVQGRLLEAFSPKMQEATLDVSGRTKGIYFVKVMTGSGVKVEKLVKE